MSTQEQTWESVLNGRKNRIEPWLVDRADDWRTCATGEQLCLGDLCTDSGTLDTAVTRADPRLKELGTEFTTHVAQGHYGRARQARARIIKHIDKTEAWGNTRADIAAYVREHGGSYWIGSDDDCPDPDPDVCHDEPLECIRPHCPQHAPESPASECSDPNCCNQLDDGEPENCVDPYCAIHHDPAAADDAPGSEPEDDDDDDAETCVDPYCQIHGKEAV